MAKVTVIFAIMAVYSPVISSFEFGSLADSFPKSIFSKEGSFAKPDLNSKVIISKNPDDVAFRLYPSSSDLSKTDRIIYKNTDSLANLTASKPYKFLIHGFLQDSTTTFPRDVKDAYLKTHGEAYNIIVVDWGKLSTPNVKLPEGLLRYKSAVENVRIVGVRTGEFIAWLKQEGVLDLNQTHVIGHSLGAHTGGHAGETVAKLTGSKIARLTGLDPAGPRFKTSILGRTMCKSDAEYVDAYHTSKGVLGIAHNVGTADFWINNGGPIQPGCLPDIGGFCSHRRSCEFWQQTVEKSTRQAGSTQCVCGGSRLLGRLASNCWREMVDCGESVTPATKGTYYIKANFPKD